MGGSRSFGKRDVDVKTFVWKNIIMRFGVPQVLIFDNGLQVDSKVFHEYCANLSIIKRYSSPAYLQSNRHAEVTNKTIVNSLKKQLEGEQGNWG